MNKRLLGLLAGAALLAACGSDNNSGPTTSSVCSKLQSVWPALVAKVPADQCPTTAAALQQQQVPANSSACTTALTAANCTSDDLGKLNTFLDCINGVPSCSGAATPPSGSVSELAWNAALNTCYSNLLAANVSSSCRTGLGLQ